MNNLLLVKLFYFDSDGFCASTLAESKKLLNFLFSAVNNFLSNAFVA